MLGGFNGTPAFIGDIIIANETQDGPLNRLFSVFEPIQQYGFHV